MKVKKNVLEVLIIQHFFFKLNLNFPIYETWIGGVIVFIDDCGAGLRNFAM